MAFVRTSPWTAVLFAVPVFAVLGLGESSAVSAQAGKKPRNQPEPQAASDTQLANAVQVLHSVKKTLEMADHDYGGHRAAAVRDIGAAVRELRQALEHLQQKKGGGKNAGGGKGGSAGQKGNPHPEPQALSDKQLADSIPVLKATIDSLKAADHDYGGHRAKAVEALQVAIGQLETALKYAAEHDKNKP